MLVSPFKGFLKYSSVFVYGQDAAILREQSIGAKHFKIPKIADKFEKDCKTFDEDVQFLDDDSAPLLLLDEEAIYLMETLHLNVVDLDGLFIDYSSLWQIFHEKNALFAVKYKVYHFFKSKGFIVKTGLHYGLDYAIYRLGPTWSHSEFCILIQYDLPESSSRLGWKQLSTLTRVMPDVLKMLLICYVSPISTNFIATSGSAAHDIEITSNNLASLHRAFGFEGAFEKDTSSMSSENQAIDFTSTDCLQKLHVKPVAVTVRRLQAKGDTYCTAEQHLAKYRSVAILKRPRMEQVEKKKQKVRRDPTENRTKTVTKNNKLWRVLSSTNEVQQIMTTGAEITKSFGGVSEGAILTAPQPDPTVDMMFGLTEYRTKKQQRIDRREEEKMKKREMKQSQLQQISQGQDVSSTACRKLAPDEVKAAIRAKAIEAVRWANQATTTGTTRQIEPESVTAATFSGEVLGSNVSCDVVGARYSLLPISDSISPELAGKELLDYSLV